VKKEVLRSFPGHPTRISPLTTPFREAERGKTRKARIWKQETSCPESFHSKEKKGSKDVRLGKRGGKSGAETKESLFTNGAEGGGKGRKKRRNQYVRAVNFDAVRKKGSGGESPNFRKRKG